MFSLNFFRSNIVNFDAILNGMVLGSTDLYVVLDYYNIAFDLYTFLKVWHRLLLLNFKFYILFSRYSKFFNVYQYEVKFCLESFYLVDFYYTYTANAFCGDMYSGFFTSNLVYRKYQLESKKIAFLLLCQQYTHDFFYKRFVQYLANSEKEVNSLIIPDFFLVFSVDNMLPVGALEFLNLKLLSLGVFDLNISAFSFQQFIYSFIGGDLSFLAFIFLLKLLSFDYICACFERTKEIILRCNFERVLAEVSDLNFNIMYLTEFANLNQLELVRCVADDLLLLVFLRTYDFNNMVIWDGFKEFCDYLYLYLYLTLVSKF